jgi:hypothetical protein
MANNGISFDALDFVLQVYYKTELETRLYSPIL